MAKEQQKHSVRTLSIPIAEILDAEKKEFYDDLRESLRHAVRVANICVSNYVKQDDWTQEKCEIKSAYPSLGDNRVGCSSTVSAIDRNASRAYLQSRKRVILGHESLRTYRSVPWYIKSQNFTLDVSHNEFLALEFRLKDRRYRVRLANKGYEPLNKAARLAASLDNLCDSSVRINSRGVAELALSIRVKPRELKDLSGEMRVVSCTDSLLAILLEGSSTPFVINADCVKEWEEGSARKFQRLRQDRKSGANRRRIRAEMAKLSEKQTRRKKSLVHSITAQIIKKAVVKRVETILFDFTIKSFCKNFPWFDLAEKIRYKAGEFGIKVVDATEAILPPKVDDPHVYFAYSPVRDQIKIGFTQKADLQRIKSGRTWCPDAIYLAVQCTHPKKVKKLETSFHAMFQSALLYDKGVAGEEWFQKEPVLAWLYEMRLIGNAGNISEIRQVLDVPQGAVWVAVTDADSECSTQIGCSHKADNTNRDTLVLDQTALMVLNDDTCCNVCSSS